MVITSIPVEVTSSARSMLLTQPPLPAIVYWEAADFE